MMALLFPPDVPEGFRCEDAFLTPEDEQALLAQITTVTFAAFEMRGVVARRRVAFFGQAYDASRPAVPMPDFLDPVRHRAAAWAGVDGAAFAMALINEYPPGAPIGWHRDAPPYDIVVGLSLASPCRMRLRPYVSPHCAIRSPSARYVAGRAIDPGTVPGCSVSGEPRRLSP